MVKRNTMLIISVVAVAIFIAIFYSNLYEIAETNRDSNIHAQRPPFMQMPIPIEYRLWLSPLLVVIAIVPISYYLISKKVENNMKVMLKLIGKNNVKTNKNSTNIINKDAIIKLLNFNERKVMERLIKKKGEVLQSEISHIEGMNKLKTHRAIKNLEMKGVIKTENRGKTKLIVLSKEIKDVMLK